jgi:hypothetical protein
MVLLEMGKMFPGPNCELVNTRRKILGTCDRHGGGRQAEDY